MSDPILCLEWSSFHARLTCCDSQGEASFVWTSHPWLLFSYFNNETGKVTDAQLQALDAGITRGDITWHANPMDMQSESAEISHLAEGMTLSDR